VVVCQAGARAGVLGLVASGREQAGVCQEWRCRAHLVVARALSRGVVERCLTQTASTATMLQQVWTARCDVARSAYRAARV